MTSVREEGAGLSGTVTGGVHRLPVRVYYEDTDFSGRVYHASYLRFCERGRSELLRASGLTHSGLKTASGHDAVFFAVRHMELEFVAPATIDDLLEVETGLSDCTGARLIMNQRIRRGDEEIFRAGVTVVALGGDGRPTRIPAGLADRVPAGER